MKLKWKKWTLCLEMPSDGTRTDPKSARALELKINWQEKHLHYLAYLWSGLHVFKLGILRTKRGRRKRTHLWKKTRKKRCTWESMDCQNQAVRREETFERHRVVWGPFDSNIPGLRLCLPLWDERWGYPAIKKHYGIII